MQYNLFSEHILFAFRRLYLVLSANFLIHGLCLFAKRDVLWIHGVEEA